MNWPAVLANEARYAMDQADCLDYLASLPPDCVDLVVTSPPYVDARLYLEGGKDLGIARKVDDWVEWMVDVLTLCSRACRGLVACVCEGRTKQYSYDCAPFLLLAEMRRRGFTLRKPPVYFRYGIPGSGGSDWWRNDWEPVLCLTRPGKLPWSDNAAAGRIPRWGPGGEMSHRRGDGARVSQWGHTGERSGRARRRDGTREPTGVRPSHRIGHGRRPGTGESTGRGDDREGYEPPILANPGNVLRQHYDAEEVRQLFEGLATQQLTPGDVLRCLAGGGVMGSLLAHENEAPYPEMLVEPFVRCFCPTDGIVLDPFSGSGTTGAVALRLGRRYLGCDIRDSQVALTRKRLSLVTPGLPGCDV